jgi:hypothetical protein
VETDRREVDPPIQVKTATWSTADQLDWWVKERQQWLARAVPDHELRRLGRRLPFGADELTESSELVVEHLLELDVGGDVLWRPFGDRHGRLIPAAERLDEHEAHGDGHPFPCHRLRS